VDERGDRRLGVARSGRDGDSIQSTVSCNFLVSRIFQKSTLIFVSFPVFPLFALASQLTASLFLLPPVSHLAPQHDNPDSSMLRFLRARKWDVDRALAMLAAALKFRFEKDIEGIIHKGEDGLKDVPGFLNQFRRGISYIKGNSDVGEYPIYFM